MTEQTMGNGRMHSAGSVPWLARFVARNRRQFIVRKVAGLCRRYLYWHANVNYELADNGERFVLEALSRFEPRVILDAGANVGDWSLAAASCCPAAQVHAFEISEKTFQRLVRATSDVERIQRHNIGLSDKAGTISIRHYDELPALTTASDYPHPHAFTEQQAKVITGDEWAAQHGVTHIDLLKIDVEGMEHEVLCGFDRLLRQGAIDMVQFEYGRVSIVNHRLLRDFSQFFRERGYVLGKIYPNYVDFRDYDMTDEDFLGPNYLACLEDRSACIAALRGVGHAVGNGRAVR